MLQQPFLYNNLPNKLQNEVDKFCLNRSIAELKLIQRSIETKIQKQYNFIQGELLKHRFDSELKDIISLREQIRFYKNSTNNILSSAQDIDFLHLYKFITDYGYKYNHDIDRMIEILNIKNETNSKHIQEQYENFINNYYNQLRTKLNDIKRYNNNYINSYDEFDEFNKIKQDLLSLNFTNNVAKNIFIENNEPGLEAYISRQLDRNNKEKRYKLSLQFNNIWFTLKNDNYEEIKTILKAKDKTEMIKFLKNFKKDCENMCEKIRKIKNEYYTYHYYNNNCYTQNTRKNNNRLSDIGSDLIYGNGSTYTKC